jgi:hypothetical protein
MNDGVVNYGSESEADELVTKMAVPQMLSEVDPDVQIEPGVCDKRENECC